MLIDTHCHLDSEEFEADRIAVLTRATDEGVGAIINPGIDPASSRAGLELARSFPMVYAAVGIHPHEAALAGTGLDEIEEMALAERVVAIGEVGLDYYRNISSPACQEEVLRHCVSIALRVRKPLILHSRNSYGELLKILKAEKASAVGGVVHCFSGDWEVAKEALDMGFHLSFTGSVTFKGAREIVEVVKKVPIDRLLLETDAPFLTPHPFRGRRNEPAYVRLVAERISLYKGCPVERIAEETTVNACRLFGIETSALRA